MLKLSRRLTIVSIRRGSVRERTAVGRRFECMLDAAHARGQTESITPDHECGELTEWAVSFNDEVDGPNVVCRYVRPWDVCRNSFGGGAHTGEWEE